LGSGFGVLLFIQERFGLGALEELYEGLGGDFEGGQVASLTGLLGVRGDNTEVSGSV
jgi:hypothetical protein